MSNTEITLAASILAGLAPLAERRRKAEEERRNRSIAQRIMLVTHVHNCTQRDAKECNSTEIDIQQACNKLRPLFVKKNKNESSHFATCTDTHCEISHCVSTHAAWHHWKTCQNKEGCVICKTVTLWAKNQFNTQSTQSGGGSTSLYKF